MLSISLGESPDFLRMERVFASYKPTFIFKAIIKLALGRNLDADRAQLQVSLQRQ
jgi:hypothetical protein